MKQVTAISWLQDKLKETYDKEGRLPLAYTFHLIKQAKELEKAQIVDAHYQGYRNFIDTTDISEKYYNETYDIRTEQ